MCSCFINCLCPNCFVNVLLVIKKNNYKLKCTYCGQTLAEQLSWLQRAGVLVARALLVAASIEFATLSFKLMLCSELRCCKVNKIKGWGEFRRMSGEVFLSQLTPKPLTCWGCLCSSRDDDWIQQPLGHVMSALPWQSQDTHQQTKKYLFKRSFHNFS